MRTSTPLLVLVATTAFSACGVGLPVDTDPGRPPLLPPKADPPIDRLREDFESGNLIDTNTGAILDVNRGTLSLAAAHFPDLEGEGDNRVEGIMQRNGLLEGGDITVAPSSAVMSSDSIELRAARTVTVGGLMRVGPGGVTIVANDRIEILAGALIDSKGPVRLMIADPDGAIVIAGEVVARTTAENSTPAGIDIHGRGSVEIQGQVRTEAHDGMTGGDISIAIYNGVRVIGAEAHIFAYADRGSRAGTVRVRSDSEVRITELATVGRDASSTGTGMEVPGRDGAIEIQGASILVDPYSRISANGPNGGGDIDVIARDLIRTGERAEIVSGPGQAGGRLTLKAARIEIGVSSLVAAGTGVTVAGHLLIDASERVSIEPGSELRAGDGGCAQGGDVRINVAGVLSVSAPATITAGNGSTQHNEIACSRQERGGSVEIVAHELLGVDKAVRAGSGTPPGTVNLRVDSDLAVAPANLAVRTGGRVVSVAFNRRAEVVGLIPQVVEIKRLEPMGTSVTVELSGAPSHEGPYGDWYLVDTDDTKQLQRLSDSISFRYRVTLEGRAYDAPVLDFFDIDLAPSY